MNPRWVSDWTRRSDLAGNISIHQTMAQRMLQRGAERDVSRLLGARRQALPCDRLVEPSHGDRVQLDSLQVAGQGKMCRLTLIWVQFSWSDVQAARGTMLLR